MVYATNYKTSYLDMTFFQVQQKKAKPSASSLKGKRPAESLSGVKKESSLSVPSSSLLGAKKPKLAGQTFTPLGRPLDERGRASPSTHIYHYDEIAKEGKQDVQTWWYFFKSPSSQLNIETISCWISMYFFLMEEFRVILYHSNEVSPWPFMCWTVEQNESFTLFGVALASSKFNIGGKDSFN